MISRIKKLVTLDKIFSTKHIFYVFIVIFGILGWFIFSNENDSGEIYKSSYMETQKIVENIKPIVGNNIYHGYYYENTNSNVVVIELLFKLGASVEPKNKEGLSSILLRTMVLGAGGHDIFDFKKILEDSSINIDAYVSSGNLVIRITTLKDYLDKALQLLDNIINEPNLGSTEINMVKNQMVAEFEINQNNTQYLLSKALRKELYGNDSNFRSSYPSIDTINRVSKEQLVDLKAKAITKSNAYISVSGNISKDAIGKKLDSILEKLPEGNTSLFVAPKYSEITNKVVTVPQIKSTQATIYLIFKVPNYSDSNYIFAKLFNTYLGVIPDSVLFNNLRNKKGLVYYINYSEISNNGNSLGVISLGTSLNKSEEAIAAVLDILQNIKQEYNFNDIIITKDWWLNNSLRVFNNNDSIVSFISNIQLNQNSFDDYLTNLSLLQKVEKQDIEKSIYSIDWQNILILKTVEDTKK